MHVGACARMHKAFPTVHETHAMDWKKNPQWFCKSHISLVMLVTTSMLRMPKKVVMISCKNSTYSYKYGTYSNWAGNDSYKDRWYRFLKGTCRDAALYCEGICKVWKEYHGTCVRS